ncbi:hypothetical protein F5Y10DRAFT_287757 [Nemania abortiva]|nr:hypothetical protein F5Y10DRAFT_287757 [Nemania abortiva]
MSGALAEDLAQMPTRKLIAHRQPSWWWWWEILAVTICIASTASLVALLKSINNTPLRQWNLPIQPNSAVASLTTISKVALLVPTASCINQLKWSHFTSAPRRLADLQLFDMASRGPWGSLVFLLRVSSPVKALVTVGFLLLTILALGLDASAQQLLQFSTQETEVKDGSTVMGAATGYSSRSMNLELLSQVLNTNAVSLQFEILNSLRGSTFDSYFACPQNATRCKWDSLVTLSLCSSWNRTSIASDGCTLITRQTPAPEHPDATYALCNYTLFNPHGGNPELASAILPVQVNLTFRLPSVNSISGNKVFKSYFTPGPYVSMAELGEFWALKGPSKTNFSRINFSIQESFKPPEAEAFYASFWWCSRSFKGITVEKGSVKYTATSSERLRFLFRTIRAHTPYAYTFTTNSTGLNYTLNEQTITSLPNYFDRLLEGEALDDYVISDGSPLATSVLLYQQDLGNMTTSVADTLTNILRSRVLDENANITDVTGTAVYEETYIRIQWQWLLLPLAETTLVTLLFILSVVITSKQPLLKDSVLAYLATAVRDDAKKTLNLRITQWTSQQELDDLAEDMVVKLESDDRGRFEFYRKRT